MATSRRPRRGAQTDYHQVDVARATTWGAALGGVTFGIGYFLFSDFTGALLAGLAAGFTVRFVTLRFASAAGSTVMHALQPSGASTPYQQQYSYQEALAARGDVAGAIESYEALLAETPDDFEARVRVAELYTRSLKEHAKAAEHFRLVQRAPSVTPDRDVYASNRLVDLYMGPLDEEGKALVELRKIVERYDGSTVAEQARRALGNIKTRRNATT